MDTLDDKAKAVFFAGFREDYLRQNMHADENEVRLAFEKFCLTDKLFESKYRLVRIFVAVLIFLKYLVPGVVIAAICIHMGWNHYLD